MSHDGDARDFLDHLRRPSQLARFDCPAVLMSKSFGDGAALLRVAEKHRLEGVVSKKREAPYRSGSCRDWVKVKTAEWKAANRDRGKLFGENGR